jgi:uncharacterized Zn finger protein
VKEQKKSWQSYEWLSSYYDKHGTPQQALESHKELFFYSPSVAEFKTLSQISLKLKNWEVLRGELLADLEHREDFSTLMEIALQEGDAAWALALLPRMVSNWRYEDRYHIDVAKIAEKDFPQEALAIYKGKIEWLIEQRGRDNYGEAVKLLMGVKTIYQQLKKLPEWNAYLYSLRIQHAKLRALQEELAAASL